MAYERQYYTNGDVLDARQMNHMETGIKENSDNIDKHSEDIATKASSIKEKASGEVIVVTDSDEAKPLGLAIDGKSEQNQYSGKNLLNARLNVDIKSNDSYKIYNVKPNTTYVLSLSQMLVVLGTNADAQHQYICYDETDNILKRGAIASMTFTSVGEVITKEATISTPENTSYIQLDLGTYFGANSSTVKTLYAQLEEGNVATEIEPYCGGIPSPNPSYPQEIRNIGKYDEASGKYAVEVKCTGKNLLDCSGLVEQTKKGVTFTPVYDENGLLEYVEANGTASADANYWVAPIIENIFNSSYIINGCPKGGSSSTYRILVDYYKNNEWAWATGDYGDGVNLTDDYPKYSVSISIKSGCTVNKLRFYPMIRPVGTDDTYEPYKETTATILLDEPLRVEDKAYWNGGSKLRIDRYRDVEVFDGSDDEGWDSGSSASARRNITTKLSEKIVKTKNGNSVIGAFCECYVEKSPNENFADTQSFAVDTSGRLLVYDEYYNTTDSSLWKAHLAENPITLEYPLVEPITEEIDIDLGGLSMFYPTTILSNDCNANMEVTYIADTKNYIDKLKAKHESDITALKTAIVALGGTV